MVSVRPSEAGSSAFLGRPGACWSLPALAPLLSSTNTLSLLCSLLTLACGTQLFLALADAPSLV